MRPRAIPVILIDDRYVVKTTAFKNATYVGDPVNTVKLFNEKQADELVLLDIGARRRGRPDLAFVESVVSEAFMPVAYGGGIDNAEDAAMLFSVGVEKVVLNTALATSPSLVSEIADRFGAQAVIANLDVRRSRLGGEHVWFPEAREKRRDPVQWAADAERRGAGEILLTAVGREGTRTGYDLDLIRRVSRAVSIPVVANGGAGTVQHLSEAIAAGASAAAAGTMFTFHGPRKAVLITYPSDEVLKQSLARSSQTHDWEEK